MEQVPPSPPLLVRYRSLNRRQLWRKPRKLAIGGDTTQAICLRLSQQLLLPSPLAAREFQSRGFSVPGPSEVPSLSFDCSSNFVSRCSTSAVSIARSCRFIIGARPAAIFGGSLPAYTSAISRDTVSRTAAALSNGGRGSLFSSAATW